MIYRFTNNSRKVKESGPLTTQEIERRRKYVVKKAQWDVEHGEKLLNNKKRLNLHKNQEKIYECHGRIEGAYPVYIPSKSVLSQKIIFSVHRSTLLGGVIMTMTKVCSRYLIPTLKELFKFIIRKCFACKKYKATSYPVPKPGPLRKARTEQCFTFQGTGFNCAGHIFHCSKTKKDLKAYILLFSCSVSRAL